MCCPKIIHRMNQSNNQKKHDVKARKYSLPNEKKNLVFLRITFSVIYNLSKENIGNLVEKS